MRWGLNDLRILALFLLLGCGVSCAPHIHLFGVYSIERDGKVCGTQPADDKTVEEIVKEHLR